MEVSRVSFAVFVAAVAVLVVFSPVASAQMSPSSAPAPASDGTSVDQGIAYVLMAVALVLTYLIHTVDLDFRML